MGLTAFGVLILITKVPYGKKVNFSIISQDQSFKLNSDWLANISKIDLI